ncbi:MAG: HlyD family efflux transporter periplasmic adaptor subunit [Burkholderiaceae bacterium]
MSTLFRAEALEARRRQWLGEVRLVRPVGLSVLVALLVASALATGAWFVLGQYTRKAHVVGVLVPDRGWVRLVAPEGAMVVERRVAEGQAVKAGDVLFVLSLDRQTRSGAAQQRVQRSLDQRQSSLADSLRTHQRLAVEQDAALRQRQRALAGESAQIDAETTLQQQRLALAQEALARLEALRGENFVSSAQVQARHEEVLGLQAQLKNLDRQRAALAREAATLEGQRRELPLAMQSRAAELEREAAGLAREAAESDAVREIVIRAPADGTVGAVTAEPGQTAPKDTALASLLPADAKLQAHLYAPSSALGFLQPQQQVQLRIAAFPYQKFGHQGGRIDQVGRTPLQAGELAALPLAARPGEPMYRVTVALDRQDVVAYGQPQPLAAGMQLEADVLLDRRRLIEWLFAPVLGIAGRV